MGNLNMGSNIYFAATLSFLFLLLPFLASAATEDLNSDKQALLAFISIVPHRRRINWRSDSPVCSSWLGVRCSADGSRVISVRIPGSGLIGAIPPNTIGKLDALQVLSLRSNRLMGSLPSDVSSLPSLHFLYLQHNNLSGEIPTSFSPSLTTLDISFNSLVGEIPPQFENLTQLSSLNLQNNSLSGQIPDLRLSKLRTLNLSYNNFSSSVPLSLQKFPNESFLGNPFLCGPPLAQCASIPPSPLPSPLLPPSSPQIPPQKHKKGFWKRISLRAIIGIAAGGAALLLVAAILFLVFLLKGKFRGNGDSGVSSKAKGGIGRRTEKPKDEFSSGVQEAEKNKLAFFEGCSYNFDLEDLLRASAEVLGKGSYGTAYKAVLEDGTTVVVKRLKEVVAGKKEFEQQMQMIGKVGQHPNVVPLRAYYYSKDEKLLVYDYLPSGSFSSMLHGNKASHRASLGWSTRVKIALETARGLTHIHFANEGRFVHGNVKSSNVLVAQDLHACISDVGLTPLMNNTASSSRVVVGYRAPEVIESQKFTQKSDVFSFGVLLLEMLTGKAPIQSPGRDDVVDLPRWVQSVVREEWTAEVFDVELLKQRDIEEEMVQMLQVAMACVAKQPDQRPKMEEVLKMMEDIHFSDSDQRQSSGERSEDSNLQHQQS